jgi:hypothetical protein
MQLRDITRIASRMAAAISEMPISLELPLSRQDSDVPAVGRPEAAGYAASACP